MQRWAVFALLPALAGPGVADERILDYHSDIEIRKDAALSVTETITVRAEGRDIRRGIYRDFPTRYKDRHGRRVRVPLEVVSVKRDGASEPWHVRTEGRGKRIYAGSEEVFLQPGVYRYEITYRTERQVGFFEGFDEIYWNATGNDWSFPIESASATVRLPKPVPEDELRLAAYTGQRGESGTDYRVRVVAPGVVRFETTRPLRPGAGLTVAVGFPKGVVNEPSAAQKRWWFIRDNLGGILGTMLLLAALAWYLYAWRRVGRDPAGGAVYPRYRPPAGYSPASLRYVWRMGFDKTCFAAGLVSLAVKRAIRLEKDAEDDYVVTKLGEGSETDSKTERKLFKKLFSAGDSLVFARANHARIGKVIKTHQGALSAAYEGRYFRRNRGWLVPGLALSLAAVAVTVLLIPGEERFIGLFLIAWLSIWSFAAGGLAIAAWRSWRDLKGMVDAGRSLITTLLAVPFVVAELVALGALGFVLGLIPLAIVVSAIAVNAVFYQLIKAPTPDGRRLLDEIEGLRMYLGTAERQDLERVHGKQPPETLERFEALLPYAVALDAADTWVKRFEAEIERAERTGELQSRAWYPAVSGGGRDISAARFASGLAGGLSSAVTSAATAPGSSSGSGGGGSSGGGGGGGGGGGW